MTSGQSLALEQVRRVTRADAAVEILRVVSPSPDFEDLRIELSVDCGDMSRKPGGLSLRDRERVTVWIDPAFPYVVPSVSVAHTRFAGCPHVNWSRWLCLYLAPQTEWSAAAGMFGFLGRLETWFRKAAIDELDPSGGAPHPPVIYRARGPLMIPRRDTPVSGGELWTGYAELEEVSDRRVDIVGWEPLGGVPRAGAVAAAILLDRPMPLEFPQKLGDLLLCLDERGMALEAIFDVVRAALTHNGKGRPLYVVLGTPMRGIKGGQRRQHLTGWRIDSLGVEIAELEEEFCRAEGLALGLADGEFASTVAASRRRLMEIFTNWAKLTDVTWCRMREDRPEVTVRRDAGRPASVFAGLAVEIWGCGALGGYIAESVVRAGAARLILRDNGLVSPGVLVRQPYVDADIGRPKAEALADRLRAVRRDQAITAEPCDVIAGPLAEGLLSRDADVVIDATASNAVLTKIEEVWRHAPSARRPVASVAIDRSADRLLAVLVRPGHCGGPSDVIRRMKLAACRDDRLRAYLDAFFPDPPPAAFQPEPGCSDATFVGSAADASHLAAAAANFIGRALRRETEETAEGCFLTSALTSVENGERGVTVGFTPDHVFSDPGTGYETRVEPAAWRAMRASRNQSRRRRGPDVETGGLLFGETDEHLRVVWVSEASGPPPDSLHSAEEFVCGIKGTAELNEKTKERTRKSVQYVGTWHTHPVSPAIPSGRDFHAMSQLLTAGPAAVDRLLLLIVGVSDQGPEVTASVFHREEFDELKRSESMIRAVERRPVSRDDAPGRKRVGLALSGGGSRAIAFHLGCLRALHDRGILGQVEVVSTVSGGSVIGAMFAYADEPFDAFESRVRSLLSRGLVSAIARRTFLSPRALGIAGTNAVAGVAANTTFVARSVLGQLERFIPKRSRARGLWAGRLQPPFRRWVSRTDAFERAFRDLLFGDARMTTARRNGIEIVINACELRTGTAFRFGSRESGSWRYGTISGNDVEVATAVAASAAYPALLPAIDRNFRFRDRSGAVRRDRVILTDGGVYENLGVTCMAPARDDAFSTNAFNPDYVICCDAGPGQFSDTALPYGWATRMSRSFEATHRQVQHGLQKQLHLWKQYGALRGFVYCYLGQQDARLPIHPPGLVRREEVLRYPTDFSPMTSADIALLSARGEQLTGLLVEHYCPEL